MDSEVYFEDTLGLTAHHLTVSRLFPLRSDNVEGEGAFSDMRHPKDCEGDFDKIEPLKIFSSSTFSS